LLAILKPSTKIIDSLSSNKDATYNYVNAQFQQQYQIKWLKPIGFNNAYALMMRKNQAKKLNIKTISNLKRYLESK
jgi:osmoprotectant transport system permease protein